MEKSRAWWLSEWRPTFEWDKYNESKRPLTHSDDKKVNLPYPPQESTQGEHSIALLILSLGTRWKRSLPSHSGRFISGKYPYANTMFEAEWAQRRSGRFGEQINFWSLPGFEPRTVQPVASRWTDWANPALGVMAVKHSSRTEMGTSRDGRDCLRA